MKQQQIQDLIIKDDKRNKNKYQAESGPKLYKEIIDNDEQLKIIMEEINKKIHMIFFMPYISISSVVVFLMVTAYGFSSLSQIFQKWEWYHIFLYVLVTHTGIFLFAFWIFKKVIKHIMKF